MEVPIRIKSLDREERVVFVQMQIAMNSVPGSHHQVLQVQLTDEQDPFFLYVMDCDEAEFHALRQEQAILVDFMIFPHKLIELLEMCCVREEVPRFLCVLERGRSGEAVFNIVETNQFKQLTHLSLRFKGGTDEVVKTHLAARVKELKILTEELSRNLHQTQEKYTRAQAELAEAKHDCHTLDSEQNRKLEEHRLQEQEKLTLVKEQMLQSQERLKADHERQLQDFRLRHERLLLETQHKLEEASVELDQLKAANFRLEATERELTLKQGKLEHELELVNGELTHLRASSKSMESHKYEQESALTEAHLTIQNLQRELLDKEKLNEKLTALLESNSDFKTQQEDSMQMLKATVEKLEDKLHQSATEINKGNHIIQKLQGEIKNHKSKLKLKNNVVLQQEHCIQEKQGTIEKLQQEMHNIQHDLQQQGETHKASEDVVKQLTRQLEEAQKTLQSNQSTIQYLNNRLTEAERVKLPYAATYKPTTTPTLAFVPTSHPPFSSPSPARSSQPDVDFSRLLEPIKYREPQ